MSLTRRFRLTLREPITLGLVDRVCGVLGVDPDRALKDPEGTLRDLTLTPSGASGLIRLLSTRPPRRIKSWPASEVVALGEWLAVDFFVRASVVQASARIEGSMPPGTKREYRRALAAL